LLVPEQWSAASLSHTPLCEAPVQLVDAEAKPFAGHAPEVPVQVSATSHWPAEDRHTVLEDANPSAGHVALVPVQLSATSQSPAAARHTVPALPAGCVHAGAPTVPLHTSVVHTLPSSVQLVPAALTVSAGQVVPAGASAMSWPMVAFDAVFAPVAPRAACAASALSEAVLVELEVWTWNRSVMPDGAPICVPPASPKQATSIVLATVVVIEGAEALTAPPKALMGLFVSTLKYVLIPPATREDDTVKV